MEAGPGSVLPGTFEAGKQLLHGGGCRSKAKVLGGKPLQQRPTQTEPEGITAGEHHATFSLLVAMGEPCERCLQRLHGVDFLPAGDGIQLLQHPLGGQQAVTTVQELPLGRPHGSGGARITADYVNPGHGLVSRWAHVHNGVSLQTRRTLPAPGWAWGGDAPHPRTHGRVPTASCNPAAPGKTGGAACGKALPAHGEPG